MHDIHALSPNGSLQFTARSKQPPVLDLQVAAGDSPAVELCSQFTWRHGGQDPMTASRQLHSKVEEIRAHPARSGAVIDKEEGHERVRKRSLSRGSIRRQWPKRLPA